MDWSTLQRQDLLAIELMGLDNPLLLGPSGLDPIIAALDAAKLIPQKIRLDSRSRPYDPDLLRGLVRQDTSRTVSVRVSRDADPPFDLDLSFHSADDPLGFLASGFLPLAHLADPAQGTDRVGGLVTAARLLGSMGRTRHGWMHPAADAALDGDTGDWTEPVRLRAVYWLNLFGSDLVDRLGRTRVMSTPAHLVEQLPNGTVLLLTRPSPVDYATEEARQAQVRALAHLRNDVDPEAELTRLRRKSAQLVQVERHWDHTVEPLLELIVDHRGYANRGPETERFNNYRPPPVSETRDELLPPDEPDVDAVIEKYHGTYAEQLLALLHDKVPPVMRQDATSLPAVDFHLWLHRYPESFPRSDLESLLVPALGAFLGKVLVRELGGRWVPRKNLDESQVVIAGRAWLPFLRARHLLQSTQSVLDHSLTQMYYTAAASTPARE